MNSRKAVCPYCLKTFQPSPFHPKQTVCLSPVCQRRRRSDYHRSKIAADAAYRQQCADSRKCWRDDHRDYQRQHRETHEAYTEQNRVKQRRRNQRRKLALIVKNNLALDAKRLQAEVWVAGPGLDVIVKNDLAIPEAFVLLPRIARLAPDATPEMQPIVMDPKTIEAIYRMTHDDSPFPVINLNLSAASRA